MSIIALQTAFVSLALLNPKQAFVTLEAEVAKIDEWPEERIVAGQDEDEVSELAISRFTLRDPDGGEKRPSTIFVHKGGYTHPEYLVVDYADGSRVIELPEDEFALIRRTDDETSPYGVLQYINQPGMGFAPHV